MQGDQKVFYWSSSRCNRLLLTLQEWKEQPKWTYCQQCIKWRKYRCGRWLDYWWSLSWPPFRVPPVTLRKCPEGWVIVVNKLLEGGWSIESDWLGCWRGWNWFWWYGCVDTRRVKDRRRYAQKLELEKMHGECQHKVASGSGMETALEVVKNPNPTLTSLVNFQGWEPEEYHTPDYYTPRASHIVVIQSLYIICFGRIMTGNIALVSIFCDANAPRLLQSVSPLLKATWSWAIPE